MMNNELRPYEKYKESKNPFSSMIPEGWQESRFHNIVKLKSICGNSNEELLSVYLNQGVIKYSDTSQKQVHKPSEDMSNYQLVEPGDLVMNNQQAWRGSLGVSKHRGVVSPAYYVFGLSKNINSTFANYLFRESAMVSQYVTSSKGVGTIQRNLFYPYLKNAIVALPPRSEQDQIVKYLDHQLAKIHKFIKAKKKLIAVLKEQKQAIINEAVTKGLDPNVKMKPSRIEWLGDVPEHWEICKLKNMATFKSGSNLTSLQIEESGDFPVYGGNGLRGYYGEYSHDGEFILIGRQGALCGNVHHVKGRFWPTEHAIVVTSRKFIDILWLKYMLIAMNLNQYSQSAAQPGLSVENITKLRTVLPEISEQKQIAQYINDKLMGIEKSILTINNEIELLSEYKNSLISDVVTGKVDVRNIVFEESEEEIIEDIKIDEDSVEEESLEEEDGDE